MRLKKSLVAAREELELLEADGYRVLGILQTPRETRPDAGLLTSETELWKTRVVNALNGIFPLPTQAEHFRSSPPRGMAGEWGLSSRHDRFIHTFLGFLDALRAIIRDELPRFTDLPLNTRLFVEDIDSFARVRDVNPAVVLPFLSSQGYLDLPEDAIQRALESIIAEPFHKADWGGETNDLYSTNVMVQATRRPTAFLLKGNGLRKSEMSIADAGKKGDQLIRLFQAPAELFIVQFVGRVSENLVADVEGKVRARRAQEHQGWYCIIDGQDTARLLVAYGYDVASAKRADS